MTVEHFRIIKTFKINIFSACQDISNFHYLHSWSTDQIEDMKRGNTHDV